MTPDSIILLDANARLTHLIDVMNEALADAKAQRTEQAWELHVLAWERLLDELMSQVDQPTKVSAQGTPISFQTPDGVSWTDSALAERIKKGTP